MSLCQIAGHTVFRPDIPAGATVLDLGANIGIFSREMSCRFGCRCLAVEANPFLCQRISTSDRISAHNYAVAARECAVRFYIRKNPEYSSLCGDVDASELVDMVSVQAIRLEEFVRRLGLVRVDLIKFDIEGAEIEVLDSTSDTFLRQVTQLTVEFHAFLGVTPLSAVRRVIGRLVDLGFYPVKPWRHSYSDVLFINRQLTSSGPGQRFWARHAIRNWWDCQKIVRWGLGKAGLASRR